MPNNSSLAQRTTAETIPPQIEIISTNRFYSRCQLSDEQKNQLSKSLHLVSDNDFESNTWEIHLPATKQTIQLSFPHLPQRTDDQILRITVLESLLINASPNYTKRIINDSQVVFRYLSDQRLFIENSSTGIIEKFASYLDSFLQNSVQKNNILRSYELLFLACVEYGFSTAVRVVDFSIHYRTDTIPKRAPDKCASDAITKLLFDISYPMPLNYRCILLTLRLIPNRISEVLCMADDFLSYTDNCFSVGIATRKENKRHIPQTNFYDFRIDGLVENIYYTVLRMQQENVSKAIIEKPECRGYLFYDPQRGRLTNIDDVNNFLKKLISDNRIVNSKGILAKVTSHDFRHISIGERLRGQVFSVVQTMVEANHSSITQTIAYGYQSEHDEAMHLTAIAETALTEIWKTGEKSSDSANHSNFALPLKKYERIKSQPFTRIIPGFGLCTNSNCAPQFEQCVKCERFSPDPMYLDYFCAVQQELEKKIATLQQKHGSQSAIDFNINRLEAIIAFIGRINHNIIGERREA